MSAPADVDRPPARQEYTVWFTGLPSSGKSTLARLVEAEIRRRGFPVVVLDGDEVRTWLTAGLGFSREDREENIRRIAHLAMFQNRAGVATITAAISPYQSAREDARRVIGRFLEVYVDCPLDVCEARDVKGLYKKARRGEVQRFTGVSDPYEIPPAPDVVVRTDRESKEQCVARIVERIEAMGFLPRGGVRHEVILPAAILDGLDGAPLKLLAAFAPEGAAPAPADPLTRDEWSKIEARLRSLGRLR